MTTNVQRSLSKVPMILVRFKFVMFLIMHVPVAAWPKALVCGRSLIETAGSNASGGVDVCLL